MAKIRNQNNQVPHVTRDTIWESDKTQENITHKRAGDHLAARSRQDSMTKTLYETLCHQQIRIALFLAHLSHWLVVSYCDRVSCAVRRQQLLQRTSPPKLLPGL